MTTTALRTYRIVFPDGRRIDSLYPRLYRARYHARFSGAHRGYDYDHDITALSADMVRERIYQRVQVIGEVNVELIAELEEVCHASR